MAGRRPLMATDLPTYDADLLLVLEATSLSLLRAVLDARPADMARLVDGPSAPVPLVVIDLAERRVVVRPREAQAPTVEVISLVGAPEDEADTYGQSTRWVYELASGTSTSH